MYTKPPKPTCKESAGKWIRHNFQKIKETCAPGSYENIDYAAFGQITEFETNHT